MLVYDQKTEDLAKTLATKFPTIKFSRGDYLFRQGEGDTSLYIILSGQVSLTTRYDGLADIHEAHVMNFGPYSAVGALSFLDSEAHKGTARALTDVTAIKISQANFKSIKEADPEAAEVIVASLVKSLQEMAATLIIKHQEREIMLRGHRK